MSLPNNFPKFTPTQPINILFVCLGNICRSPTCDGVTRKIVKERNLTNIFVDSCGTAAYHIGSPPDERSTKHASRRGYDLACLRARKLCSNDFEQFDIILVADESNYRNVRNVCPNEQYFPKIKFVNDFLTKDSRFYGTREVPDPYYGGASGFDDVLDMCEDACGNLIDVITANVE